MKSKPLPLIHFQLAPIDRLIRDVANDEPRVTTRPLNVDLPEDVVSEEQPSTKAAAAPLEDIPEVKESPKEDPVEVNQDPTETVV